jgi:hypothetical protein
MPAPSPELPVAYVSMARRLVFVDHEYRDRASWSLEAHISVSTAHWRIPLAGDPRGEPVVPGDSEREFEEVAIHELDPTMRPAEGDIRVLRGGRSSLLVDFGCMPIGGASGWCSAGPWAIERCDGGPDDVTREDFGVVGPGRRYHDRACAELVGDVQLLSWSVRS